MKITRFHSLIATRDAASAIQMFEALGFVRCDTREGTGEDSAAAIRMRSANGLRVDVSRGDGEWSVIRVDADGPSDKGDCPQ